MSEPYVALDQTEPYPAGQNPTAPVEEQLTSALRTATDRVHAEYTGEPVERVCQRLLDETRVGLHPDLAEVFEPDMDEFCRVAIAIVRGDLGHTTRAPDQPP